MKKLKKTNTVKLEELVTRPPALKMMTMMTTTNSSMMKSLMNHASQLTHEGRPIILIASRILVSFSLTSARVIDMDVYKNERTTIKGKKPLIMKM